MEEVCFRAAWDRTCEECRSGRAGRSSRRGTVPGRVRQRQEAPRRVSFPPGAPGRRLGAPSWFSVTPPSLANADVLVDRFVCFNAYK